ncbi:MAG: FKBP-type peptidyl-prolyl cis-trans isomerase [Spirochaetales bacterium]|nr:FKBP-type peptidyl-prolyl cis-trans isomerase [Spirochaetales bacterium]
MIINKNSVVKLKYKLTDASNNLIDSSDKNGSLVFIYGVGMMMPGIEKIIEGQTTGFEFNGDIEPEDGYGEYRPENVFPIPRSQMEHLIDQMEEGKSYNFDTGAGQMQMLKVVKIDEEFVTLDANHPYAGEILKLECTIEGVREATQDELESLNHHHSSCGCGNDHDSCCSSGDGEHSGGCCSSGDHDHSGECCSSGSGNKSGCGCKH